MGERTSHEPGTFSWVDLATTDTEGAKGFYQEIFGWDIEDLPIGDGSFYSMCKLNGKEVAAISPIQEEMKAKGHPPYWNSYITVEDADATTARAKELGASILAGPFDVMDAGRMAAIQDPTGAAFSVWQPKETIGAQFVNGVGAFCWNELATRDSEAGKKFYTALFGWDIEEMPNGDLGTYFMFKRGKRSMGGMYAITEQHGPMPSNWSVYFAVEKCDDKAGRVKDLGGQVIMPPTDISWGRIALVSDPQGAAFALFEGETDE